MGPRLDSRGNARTGLFTLAIFALQWGRDLIVAETDCRLAGSNFAGDTSMGPRLDSRGNGDRFLLTCDAPRTSMGPRLDSRGNGLPFRQ